MKDLHKPMNYMELGQIAEKIAGKMERNREEPCDSQPEDWLQDFYLAAWVLTKNATQKVPFVDVSRQGWKQLCGCRDQVLSVARGLNIPGIEVKYSSPPADQQAIADRLEKQMGRAYKSGGMKNPPEGSGIKVSCRWRTANGGAKLSKRKLKKMRRNGGLNRTP
mgnify:FL=1